MPSATYRMHQKLSDGSYQAIHAETEAGVVLRPNGETVEQTLRSCVLKEELSSHTGNTSNPHGVTKAQIGLGNVDNTADAQKSVNYANSAGTANTATGMANSNPGAASLKNIYAGTADIGAGAGLATGTIYLVYE